MNGFKGHVALVQKERLTKLYQCASLLQNHYKNAFVQCKINCGPGYEVSGSNKVKCKDGQWKHELKSIDMKTCVKKIT